MDFLDMFRVEGDDILQILLYMITSRLWSAVIGAGSQSFAIPGCRPTLFSLGGGGVKIGTPKREVVFPQYVAQ